MNTVHVVDDDPSFLQATARLLAANGFTVRTHRSAAAFLEQWDREAPGCVVTDLQMPGVSGLELQQALAQARNPPPVLILTGHGDVASTRQALRGGAEDYLEKLGPAADLLDAVRRALARDVQQRAARARQDALAASFAALSAREREVLTQVVRGRLNKQIAGDLDIHERTVKLHRHALMSKLAVHSVADLMRLAQEAGVLDSLQRPAGPASSRPSTS